MRKLFIFLALCAILGLLTASTYTINVPGTIDWATFTVGDHTSTGNEITVSTVSSMTMCGITVENIRTNAKGYLTLGGSDDADLKLTDPLMVKGGDLGNLDVNYVPLTSDRILRASTTAIASANISDFAVSQTIASGDLTKTAGTYSLIMTFTATFSGP
jgi:hypothetical protein